MVDGPTKGKTVRVFSGPLDGLWASPVAGRFVWVGLTGRATRARRRDTYLYRQVLYGGRRYEYAQLKTRECQRCGALVEKAAMCMCGGRLVLIP